MSYSRKLQMLANEYLREHPAATTREIASWAIAERRWAPHPNAIEQRLADELANAMREEYFTDPQGRSVRAKHAARVKRNGTQMVFWADLRSAPHRHMEISFQQRRKQIVGDCRQLKMDVDSYNENVSEAGPIQLVLDFTDDVAEIEALERGESAA